MENATFKGGILILWMLKEGIFNPWHHYFKIALSCGMIQPDR